ncbi:MAG: permease [Pleomorphochaeta sp.]
MNKVLYVVTSILLLISFFKDKEKTKKALLKGGKSLLNVLPLFLAILVIVGLIVATFNANLIAKLIGENSGWLGTIFAAFLGTFVMIPSVISLPMAKMLIDSGAGYLQIGAFLSTLFLVQLASVPIEMKYFGKKVTIIRNVIYFFFAFFIAYILYLVMG